MCDEKWRMQLVVERSSPNQNAEFAPNQAGIWSKNMWSAEAHSLKMAVLKTEVDKQWGQNTRSRPSCEGVIWANAFGRLQLVGVDWEPIIVVPVFQVRPGSPQVDLYILRWLWCFEADWAHGHDMKNLKDVYRPGLCDPASMMWNTGIRTTGAQEAHFHGAKHCGAKVTAFFTRDDMRCSETEKEGADLAPCRRWSAWYEVRFLWDSTGYPCSVFKSLICK